MVPYLGGVDITPPAPLSSVSAPTTDDLIEQHLWVADRLARRYRHRGEPLDDLIQVARLGLVEAASRFDPDRGTFPAFANSTITGVLKRHFRDHCWAVRPPRHVQELALRIRQLWPTLSQQHTCVPDVQTIADAFGESPAAVREAMAANANYRFTHLDPLVDEPGPSAAGGHTPFDQVEARLEVTALLRTLGEGDRSLLWMRFVEERTQSDIAAALGTSQMQVSRRLRRLLDGLHDRSDDSLAAAA